MSAQPWPQAGDYWSFKVPDKRRRTKEVGSVIYRHILVERGTYPKWKDKTKRQAWVRWQRANGGRYSGISVVNLRKYGRLVSTKAERDAHFAAQLERARANREKSRPGLGLCCMRTAERQSRLVAKGAIINCEKCGQAVECLGGGAWKAAGAF